nr:hypothetical protein [Tanacetum cinerariifolium]
METKYTLSSCSNLEAQQMQQIQDKAKKSCMSIPEFRDTLIQHLESVKKLIDERVQLKREYDSWVNERQMHTTKEKVDTSKALDASLVDTESSRTESKEQDESSRSGNNAHDDVADIRPIYDEEPMADVQTTAEINVFAIGQQHTEQPEFNNERKVVQNAKECHDTCPLHAILTDNQIPEHSYQSLKSENSCLKKTVAQFQKDFSRLEAHCVNLELNSQNQVLNEGQQSQFSKEKSNEAKEREAAFAKPHHMIASSNSRISSKNMKRFSSNDMVHNHYLEEAKKRTQERSRNLEPNLVPFARLQSTTNGSKPMPRRNIQTSRNWPASKNSFVTTKTVPIAEHLRNSSNDSCVTKFLKETSVVQKKTITPRSCLRWKPTGKIFKTVGLRWIPTGNIFAFSTTKVDSEPLNGSNADITNQYECEQTLDVSADVHVPSQQELDLLFGPLYDEFFNAEEEHLPDDEFTNPFCAPAQDVAESSSLDIDPEMCMFALTVSTAEPKNIKEAMGDSAWIEAMQEELHQFDRL